MQPDHRQPVGPSPDIRLPKSKIPDAISVTRKIRCFRNLCKRRCGAQATRRLEGTTVRTGSPLVGETSGTLYDE